MQLPQENALKSFLLGITLVAATAIAQGQSGNAFPPSSVSVTAAELTAYLSGKTFRATYANGTTVQSKFGADGSLAATATGFYDTGKWRAEDGKLCGSLRKVGEFCNEARFVDGILYLRRMNGEVIHYEAE